jgi:hypothetical protein
LGISELFFKGRPFWGGRLKRLLGRKKFAPVCARGQTGKFPIFPMARVCAMGDNEKARRWRAFSVDYAIKL